MEEEFQTSIEPEMQPGEVNISGELNETEPEQTPEEEIVEDTEEETQEDIDYKTKFSESSKEALRLLEENKRLKETLEKGNASGQEDVQTPEQDFDTKKELLLVKEELALKDYLQANPTAAPLKETLRKFARIEPKKDLQTIWDEHIAPAIEVGKTEALSRKQAAKANQPESGKGSISSDPLSAEIDLEAFSSLPLEKQKEILKKKGY